MGKKIDNKQAFEQEFERLRKEIGDYKPDIFNHLRIRFFEFYQDRRYKFFTDKELKEGRNPVLEWLKYNYYPVCAIEKGILQFVMSLTKESAKELLVLMERYLFMAKNSPTFRHKVEEFGKHGGNYLRVWMGKYHFKPVFKEMQ